jgi:glycolate oxidase
MSAMTEDSAEAERRAARQAEVAAALSRVLPASALLVRREDTAPYECDGLTAFKALPMAVVLNWSMH